VAAGELCDPEINLIIEKLCASSDPATRYFAKKTIKKLKDSIQKVEPELAFTPAVQQGSSFEVLKVLLASSNSENRQRALKALAVGFNMEALPVLVEMLKSEKDPFVIASIVKLVGKYGGPENIESLSVFLNHEDPRVRANTIEGLELAGTDKIIAYIVPFINDVDNRIRANAVKALSKFKSDEMLEVLGSMIRSDQLWMRDSAIFALQQVASEQAVELLCGAVMDSEKNISNNAMQALIKIGSVYALKKVDELRLALKEKTAVPSFKKLLNAAAENAAASSSATAVTASHEPGAARAPEAGVNKTADEGGDAKSLTAARDSAAPAQPTPQPLQPQTEAGGAMAGKNEGAFEKLKANITKKETTLINIVKDEDSLIMANFKIDLEDNFTGYVNEIAYVSLSVLAQAEKKKPAAEKNEANQEIMGGGTLKQVNAENAAKFSNEAKKKMLLDSLKGGKVKK
jgi:HEAT repeat protein